MVYTSGAVTIEHEGAARVFYNKQKPRVCTINHKPRPSYNWLVQYDASHWWPYYPRRACAARVR